MPVTKAIRVALLPALWVATASLMARDWTSDPYNPSLTGSDVYGHNHEGALVEGLVLTLIELAVLTAILRPWSYDRSWGRSLVAAALLVPWAAISMIGSMHQGSIRVLHFTWVFVALVGIFIAFLVSVFSVYRALPRRA
jgi:hypothetical protein